MINLAVVPLVNAVDTFWVGRLGVALTLAGQAAANQAFFTIFFLVNYFPTITAPLVATAVGSGNAQEAQDRVTESLYLSILLGGLGTILLVGIPRWSLQMVLQPDAPAMEFAAPYLRRLRALSMVTALISATGFAAYRVLLDTVTPLKVSLATNVMNLILDPLLIATKPLGFLGTAIATALSESMSGLVYTKLLIQKHLVSISKLVQKPPSVSSLVPLLQGRLTMLGGQAALNVCFVFAARRAQSMDPSGVSAAAYGIVMQIYSLGLGDCAPISHARDSRPIGPIDTGQIRNSRCHSSRRSDICVGQSCGTFVRHHATTGHSSNCAAIFHAPGIAPAVLSSMLHFLNGFVFAGEGVLLGLQKYRDLMLLTATSVASMIACLATPLGKRLDGILLSIMVFNAVQAIGVVVHHLKIGPLARKRIKTATPNVN